MSKSFILESISHNFPFPLEVLERFYEIHNSLDLLIEVCEYAARAGSADIFQAYTDMTRVKEGDKLPILCLDFDGVCNSYMSGWQGPENIPDAHVAGLFEFLETVSKSFDVQIYSTRSNYPGGIEAMQEWFVRERNKWMQNGHENSSPLTLTFPVAKPPAFLTLDDRSITFSGEFPSLEELKSFKPWWQHA